MVRGRMHRKETNPRTDFNVHICIYSQIISLHTPYTARIFTKFTSCIKVASSACHVLSVTQEPQLYTNNY